MPKEPDFTVYYDALQESEWFRNLDPRLTTAAEEAFGAAPPQHLTTLLQYDRPDIILCDGNQPILVLERSEEVPTGHNVGQRFGRLVAAAEARTPCVYFFPFAAFKHGGETSGPRYLNLRLLQALDKLESIYKSLQLSVCWPVDEHYELIRTRQKDEQVGAILGELLDAYIDQDGGTPSLTELNTLPTIITAREAIAVELGRMAKKNREYRRPPRSVEIIPTTDLKNRGGLFELLNKELPETVVYRIGMTYVRSDPYTGTAMIYDYIYCRNDEGIQTRNLVLRMNALPSEKWDAVMTSNPDRKDVRIYRQVANAILFKEGKAISGERN